MAQSAVSNDMVIGKRRIGKDVEGSCRGEMCSPIVAFIERKSGSQDIQCTCSRFEPNTYSIRARSATDCAPLQSIFIKCISLERNSFSGTVRHAGQQTVTIFVNVCVHQAIYEREFWSANVG